MVPRSREWVPSSPPLSHAPPPARVLKASPRFLAEPPSAGSVPSSWPWRLAATLLLSNEWKGSRGATFSFLQSLNSAVPF